MKKKPKKKQEKAPPVQPPLPKKDETQTDTSDNSYGGIPMRDLKKNLGCG